MASIRHDCGLVFKRAHARVGMRVNCPYCPKAGKFTVTEKNLVKMGR